LPTVEREQTIEARRTRRAGWFARLALLVTVATFPLSCIGLCVGSFWIFLALGFGVGGILLSVRAFERLDQARTAVWMRDAGMVDEFGSGVGWLVDLIVHQGDAPTGTDRGMLWVEDDRLIFAGRRTSFALAASEVLGRCHRTPPVPSLRLVLSLFLRTQTPAGRLGVSFVPLERAKWQSGVTVNDVQEAVTRWLHNGVPGESDLPPLTPGPDAPTSDRLLLRAALVGTYWTALIAGLSGLLLWSEPIIALAVAMVGLLIGLSGPILHSPRALFRAWWDRRRIA